MRHFLSRLGGRRSCSKQKPDPSDVIVHNRKTIDTLEEKEKAIQQKLEETNLEIQQRVNSRDKRGVLCSLRRKTMLERELGGLAIARLALEQQIISLESAQTQQIAVGALACGVRIQKEMNKELHSVNLSNLMNDMLEQQERQIDISQVLSCPLYNGDEDEQLNQLQAEILESKLLQLSSIPRESPSCIQSQLRRSMQSNKQVLGQISITSECEQLNQLKAEFAL